MKQIDQLKCVYNQFFALADEIERLIDSQEYEEAFSKLEYKNSLISKLMFLKLGMNFNKDEQKEISGIEEKMVAREKENIDKFSKIRDDVKQELAKTKSNLKLNTAYSSSHDIQGSILDFTE